jgi:hypothetical protein
LSERLSEPHAQAIGEAGMLQKLREIDEAKIAAESRVRRVAENTAKYGWEARPVYIIHKGRHYSGGK